MLLERAVEDARTIGYTTLLLESPKSWKSAHSLYKSAGFLETQMHSESEVPAEFRQYWIFYGVTSLKPIYQPELTKIFYSAHRRVAASRN